MHKCSCDLCQQIRKFKEVIEPLNPEQKTYFNNFFDAHLEMSNDLDYYKALVYGQIEDADGIISRIRLKKAKE